MRQSASPLCALLFFVASLVVACGCSTNSAQEAADAAADGPDGASHPEDAGVVDAAPVPRDLDNGEPCSVSAQCKGACCELHQGNSTVCAQITPFDTTQNCTCTQDVECAAIQLCGKPDFCQEGNDVTPLRFCSRLCK